MKIRFNRQEMADALRAICGVAATRTPKPVLKCVRLEALADVLLLSATDLELSLRCAVTQVEVDEAGDTLAVADTLFRIVSECPDELLTAETAENVLHLRGEGSHFQVVTQDPAEFPAIPVLKEKADFSIEHGVLSRLISWTSFAAARESTRYAINGVLWEVEGEKLILAATDGRRLSLARGATVAKPEADVQQTIVPCKALTLFERLPAHADTNVDVKVTSNQVLLAMGGATISSSVVEGHFPKYQDVVPKDCDRVVVLKTADFLSAIKRASLLTNEESKGIRLSLVDRTMTLTSRAPEQGEASVSVPIEYDSEPLEIGFNPVFLLDVLRVADTEDITIAFREANRPGLITVGDDFLYVVMPVNLASS